MSKSLVAKVNTPKSGLNRGSNNSIKFTFLVIMLKILIPFMEYWREYDRMYWDTEKNYYFSGFYVLGQLKK